jgi:hypothetical protein
MPILESIITFGSFLPTLSRIAYYFSGTQTNFAKTKYYDIRAESYRAKTEKSNSNSPASENLRKAEKNYSQQKAKHEQQILKLEREKLSIEKQKLEFQQLELELRVEISAKRFELLREFQQENVDLKWQEIQLNWDGNDNWFSPLNRRESADILGKYANCLLILTSEPKIAKDSNLDLFRDFDFKLEMLNLDDFIEKYYPCRDVSHPVKHYSSYFEETIGKIEVEQLHSILNKISTYVIYPDITTKKITFRIAFWGINGELENLPPIEWNWQEAQKELVQNGKSEVDSISDIRDSFVEIHKLITAFLIDSYYLYIDPLYDFRFGSLETELELKLPQELINPFEGLQQKQKTEYLNYLETLKEKPMSATQIRKQFAKSLADVVQTMQVAESEGLKEESSGQLSLADKIKRLKEKSARLDSGTFNISLIGEFNRGKTTILNVLLGKPGFLPTSQVPTTALPTYIKYGEKEEATLFFSSEKDKLDFLKDKQNKKIKDRLIREGEKSITVDLDTYRDFFSFDSDFLSDLLDKFASWFTSNEQKDTLAAEEEARKKWLTGKEYFEITACVDLLREGVQFLDTAGLNDLNSINEKTKEQISNSDAILFIMAADQSFDLTEIQYLEEIKKDPRTNIFYLTNKWEIVTKDKDKKQVHKRFTKKFQGVFDLKTEEEAEKLWGDRLFEIQSLNAETKLIQKETLDGTGFIEFAERLDNYLKNEKLQEQILNPVTSTEECVNECDRLISERLQTMKLDIDGLNEVIEKTDEPLTEIENNCSNIKKIIDSAIKSYNGNVILSYRDVFRETKTKLERILTLSSIKDLADKSKNDYVKELQESYTDIVSGALKSWDERSKSELRTSVDTTNLSIESSVKLYNESRKKITEIIQETIEKQVNENIEKGLDPRLPPSESQSVNVRSGNAISDTILVGTITTGGTLLSASLLGIAAHTAGLLTTHLFWAINPVTGAVLAVTPLGWAVLAGAVGGGVFMGIKARTDKIENFKKDIINQLQQELEKYTKDEEIEKIKKMIESFTNNGFSPLMEKQQTMLSNAQSIRDSLNNQKIQLENGKINYEEEESRLINLRKKLSEQLQEIVEEYNKYFPSVQEETTSQEV